MMTVCGAGSSGPTQTLIYGVVVESVNVSVLAYVPVRSASVELTCCRNVIATGSLDTGLDHVLRTVGAEEPPTSAAALPALACSGEGSENVPLTRWPVAVADGSATDSVASPAVEMTLADCAAV